MIDKMAKNAKVAGERTKLYHKEKNKSFILQDYTERSTLESYKWPHPKKRVEDNVNRSDSNILGLERRFGSGSKGFIFELCGIPRASLNSKQDSPMTMKGIHAILAFIELLRQTPEVPTDSYRKMPIHRPMTPMSGEKRPFQDFALTPKAGDLVRNLNLIFAQKQEDLVRDLKPMLAQKQGDVLETESQKSDCSRYAYVCSGCINQKLVQEKVQAAKMSKEKDLKADQEHIQKVENLLHEQAKEHEKRKISVYKQVRAAVKQAEVDKVIAQARDNEKGPTKTTILDDKFGINHGKNRETQREKVREIMRGVVSSQLLKKVPTEKSIAYHMFLSILSNRTSRPVVENGGEKTKNKQKTREELKAGLLKQIEENLRKKREYARLEREIEAQILEKAKREKETKEAEERRKKDVSKSEMCIHMQQIAKQKEDAKKREEMEKKEYREKMSAMEDKVKLNKEKKQELAKELDMQIIEKMDRHIKSKEAAQEGVTSLLIGKGRTLCAHGKKYFCNQCNKPYPKKLLTKQSVL